MYMPAQSRRSDYIDTHAMALEAVRPQPAASRQDASSDAAELLASTDAADSRLLRMVGCVAVATLALALASSLGV